MKSIVSFIAFSFIGGVGLALNLGVAYALKEFAGLWYFWAFLAGVFVNWTFNFFANSYITFRGHSRENYSRKYAKFLLIYCCAFFINAALVYVMTSFLSVYYLVSIAIAAFITAFFNFFLIKKIVFR
jgi:putative flippase GtrA